MVHHRGREQLVPAVRSGGQKGSCGAFLERGRVPRECGGQQDLEGDAHSVSRCGGLLLVCTLGGLEQLRRRPPPAAETGSRSRGSGRRGGGPLKGRTPMREPQPARRRRSAGTNSPVDCWLARGRVPGECGGQQGLTGGSLTESVGLLFCCYSPGRRVGAPSGTRTAAEATAVCGGNREPKQGQRSQRRRPAQGAPDDAGTATRTVPAVRSGGQKGSCAAMRGSACKVWSSRWPASFFQRSLPVRRRSMRGAVPSRRCGRMSAPWRSTFWCWSGQSRAATRSSRRSWGCKSLAVCGHFVV